MTARTVVAAALVAGGVAICVLAAVGALLARRPLDRLHFLAPVTSLGTPLVGAGLAVHGGWHLATAMVLVCVLLPAVVAGPVLASATGRAVAERDAAAEQPT